MPRPSSRRRSQAGKRVDQRAKPTPGWKGSPLLPRFANPRPPSVPTTMDLRLDEYFAGAALVGVLSSQHEEPDTEWACEWAWKMGRKMAHAAVKLRAKKRA